MDGVIPELSVINWRVLDTHPIGHSAPRQDVDGIRLARHSLKPHRTQFTFFDKEKPGKQFAARVIVEPGLKEAAPNGFAVSKSNHSVAMPNWTPDFW